MSPIDPICWFRVRLLAERKVLEMIIMAPNKKWSDLRARETAPFMFRGLVQFADRDKRDHKETIFSSTVVEKQRER
jgi:hypothetical protein